MRQDEALALLAAAYESGIRHFDTAPLYGWGAAEDLLGAFGRGKLDLAIVTKVGIAPPSKVARLIAKAPGVPAARPAFGQFDPKQVKQSFDTSLRRLQRDHVSALLLHEATADDVTDALMTELMHLKQSGKTAALGLATSAANTAAILERYPTSFDIVQVAANGLPKLTVYHGSIIVHSVLGVRLRELAKRTAADPALAADLGVAPGDTDALARCLLRAALAESHGGAVLFSSSRPDTIRANAALRPADPDLLARVRALHGSPQAASS